MVCPPTGQFPSSAVGYPTRVQYMCTVQKHVQMIQDLKERQCRCGVAPEGKDVDVDGARPFPLLLRSQWGEVPEASYWLVGLA